MNVIKDKDLIWDTDNYDVILVGTSIYNMLTQGFQAKMALKYPHIVEVNDSTTYADTRKYGKCMIIDGKPKIILMYMSAFQNSLYDVVNYEALEQCLETVNNECKGLKVASTIIGASRFDGGGDKERCLRLMLDKLKDIDLTIYDYEQVEKRYEIAKFLRSWNELRFIPRWKELNSMAKQKKEILLSLFLKR